MFDNLQVQITNMIKSTQPLLKMVSMKSYD